MAGPVVTIDELLAEHVGLGVECLDRIYLNGYVPGQTRPPGWWVHLRG